MSFRCRFLVLFGVAVSVLLLLSGCSRRHSVATLFRYGTDSPNFHIRSTMALNLNALAVVAETAKRITTVTFCSSAPDTPRVTIYLCETAVDLALIEDLHGVAPPTYSSVPEPERAALGGYYHDVPMIAICVSPSRLEEVIAHEVAHAVVEHIAPSCSPLLNEGIAMYVAENVLGSDPSLEAAENRYMNKWHGAAVRVAATGIVLRDAALVRSPEEGQRAYGSAFYVTAWCLVRALARLDEDTLQRVLKEVADRGGDAWSTLSTLYGADTLERETLREVRALATATRR